MTYQLLLVVTLILGIVPLPLLLFKRISNGINTEVTPFIILTAFASIYEGIGTLCFSVNTAYWFQLYSLLEILALFYFFYRLLAPFNRRSLQLGLFFLILSYLFSFSHWHTTSHLISNGLNKTTLTFFVLYGVMLWIKIIFKQQKIPNLWQHSSFYFVSGFFLYYGNTILLFLLGNLIYNSTLNFYEFWFINILSTLLLRILLILGIWKMK